jgi:hypothetical protein
MVFQNTSERITRKNLQRWKECVRMTIIDGFTELRNGSRSRRMSCRSILYERGIPLVSGTQLLCRVARITWLRKSQLLTSQRGSWNFSEFNMAESLVERHAFNLLVPLDAPQLAIAMELRNQRAGHSSCRGGQDTP